MVVGAVVVGAEVLDSLAGAVVVVTIVVVVTVVVVDVFAASWISATSTSDSTMGPIASSETSRSIVVVVDSTSPARVGEVSTGPGSGVGSPTTTKSRAVVRRRAALSA